jgi:hypothetical protein
VDVTLSRAKWVVKEEESSAFSRIAMNIMER